MTGRDAARFPISFDRWYRWLSHVVGVSPSAAYVDLHPAHVEVRMGWTFRTRFPRAAIASVSVLAMRPLSRGVHGFAGRWLVNGSGREIVQLRLAPPQRAYVLGVPVRVRELLVSVPDAPALSRALEAAA